MLHLSCAKLKRHIETSVNCFFPSRYLLIKWILGLYLFGTQKPWLHALKNAISLSIVYLMFTFDTHNI